MHAPTLFLHGLDSSSKGTKGRYFTENFPDLIAPDFTGSLQERLRALEMICTGLEQLVMIGSSFGGLMATCFAIAHPDRVQRLLLLAPALNFPEYSPPASPLQTPTRLIIGRHDTVTPPDLVIPAARATFMNLEITFCNDDHFLRTAFFAADWRKLLT